MAAIVINISNAPGASVIKRKVIVEEYHKSYVNENYVVPYKIEHYDSNDQRLPYIPDYVNVLIADNIIRVWVNAQLQYFDVETPNCTEMGMFQYLQELQKHVSDEVIINGQFQILDGQGRFSSYL